MLLDRLVQATAALSATRSRIAKRQIIASVLADADADDVELVVGYLSGALRQRRTGLGWRALAQLPEAAARPELRVQDVDEAMAGVAEVTGSGSQARRQAAVTALFARATEGEQRLLTALVLGELRQGALEAHVQEGLAEAYGVSVGGVRRAAMLLGSTPEAARLLVAGGEQALRGVGLRTGVAVQPMLAASAPDVATAMAADDAGLVAVEVKLDGIRLQVHKRGERVRLFTRSLEDVTERMPEIVAEVAALPQDDLVADGEALMVRSDGRPEPFQVTASRTATREADPLADRDLTARLSLFVFDLLRLEGVDLLDAPLHERISAMAAVLPPALRVDRLLTDDPATAEAFFTAAVAQGYEGVVVKSLDAPYAAGRRDAAWVKVKPRHTFDLVVLAAEWGHGRRQGRLSNLHLGARAEDGGWVMLGKTFKGLTDSLLAWQTAELLAREVRRTAGTVWVEPSLVVEIACDGLQRSTRYPGGVTLRFARVLRYRTDKPASEVDTLTTVRALLPTT